MHRAAGGVLARVITVPGFIPGQEIDVDHHLRAINERLALRDERAPACTRRLRGGAVVK